MGDGLRPCQSGVTTDEGAAPAEWKESHAPARPRSCVPGMKPPARFASDGQVMTDEGGYGFRRGMQQVLHCKPAASTWNSAVQEMMDHRRPKGTVQEMIIACPGEKVHCA